MFGMYLLVLTVVSVCYWSYAVQGESGWFYYTPVRDTGFKQFTLYNGSNPDGSFTMDESNTFLSPQGYPPNTIYE